MHKDKLHLHLLLAYYNPAINKRDYVGIVRLLYNHTPFLLLEEGGTLLITRDTQEAALKHLTTLPLVFLNNAVRQPDLIRFVGNILLIIGASSYLYLISLENLCPLLSSLILIILSPLEARLTVLLNNRWLLISNISFVA